MSKSITKNYLYNLFYQLLTVIIPLVTAPYVSRVLGADGVGTASYAESVLSYFSLFATMGITLYGQREISYVQTSLEKRSHVFWETQLLKLLTTLAATAVYLLFCLTVVGRAQKTLYLILAIQLVAVAADAVWFFQGMEEFGKVVFRNTLTKVLGTAFIFLFVRDEHDLPLYLLGQVSVILLSSLALWGYLPKYVCRVPLRTLRPFRNIRVVLALFVPTVAIQIYTVLDKTMIGLITQDAFQNGYYEQAMKIARTALTAVRALGTVMIPRIGFHFEQGETETVRNYVYRSYRFAWMLAIPMCLGLALVADRFVPWFFGEGYDGVVPLLAILSLLLIAIGINSVTGDQYLIPTKREKIYTAAIITGATVNFCLNMLMIPRLGAVGAAIASVIAETVIALMELIILRRELSIGKIALSGLKYLAAALVMAAVLLAERPFLRATVPHTCIMVASGAAVYFGFLLLIGDEFVLSAVRKILGKIRK